MKGLMKMTSYEKGFITKCAEYGIDGRKFIMYKSAEQTDGKIQKKKKVDYLSRMRRINLMIGALIGAYSGGKSYPQDILAGASIGALSGMGLGAINNEIFWQK